MGRPMKLTPVVQQRIVSALEAGNYREAAAAYAGIDYGTFGQWMRRGKGLEPGRRQTPELVAFVAAVEAAEARAEVAIVAQWRAKIPENWPAARDFLARRYPDRWSNRERIEQTQQIEITERDRLTDEDRANRILAILDRVRARRDRDPDPADPPLGAASGAADDGLLE